MGSLAVVGRTFLVQSQCRCTCLQKRAPCQWERAPGGGQLVAVQCAQAQCLLHAGAVALRQGQRDRRPPFCGVALL